MVETEEEIQDEETGTTGISSFTKPAASSHRKILKMRAILSKKMHALHPQKQTKKRKSRKKAGK